MQPLMGRDWRPGGCIADGAGDLCDDVLADGEGRAGVGDEDSEGDTAAIGQGDEGDVVGGVVGSAVLAGGAGFIGGDGAGRKQSAHAGVCGVGGGHPAEEKLGVRGRERRAAGEAAENGDQGTRCSPIAVLKALVLVEGALRIDDSDVVEADAVKPGGDHGGAGAGSAGTGQKAKEDVAGDVVTLDDGAAHEVREGNVDVAVRILVAQRAVDIGRRDVGGQEADGLVEGETALLDLVEHRHGDGEFEDGLHGQPVVWMEVAVERVAGERAGDADASLSLGGDAGDQLLEPTLLRMSGEWRGEEDGCEKQRSDRRRRTNEHARRL